MGEADTRREARIGVAPYADGSGYEAMVKAWLNGDQPVFLIDVRLRLAASDWPELRQAVEDALALVSRPTPVHKDQAE